MKFEVFNKDGTQISFDDIFKMRKEDWAEKLMFFDIDGFAITEDGNLVLMDKCGSVACVPYDRFAVVYKHEPKHLRYKSYSDATLKGMSKDELIRLIRCLEHNWLGAEESCEHQYKLLTDYFNIDNKEENIGWCADK